MFKKGDKVASTIHGIEYTVLGVQENGLLHVQHNDVQTKMVGGKMIEYHFDYTDVDPAILRLIMESPNGVD